MTGPEHWHEAERQLEWVNGTPPGDDDEGVRVRLSMAQVHATLAVAAATMTGIFALTPAGGHEWRKALDPEYAAGVTP